MENPIDPNKKDKRLRGRALTKRTCLVVRDLALLLRNPLAQFPTTLECQRPTTCGSSLNSSTLVNLKVGEL